MLAITLIGAAPQQDVAVIDLTIPRPPAPPVTGVQEDHVFRAGPMPSDPRAQKLTWPLSVTLVDLRRASEAPEKVIVEMRLTATAEVTIPRSEDGRRVDPEGRHTVPGYKQMMVGLRLDDKVADVRNWMSYRGVYGSSAVPGSLITLQAGQSVTLRFDVHRDALMQKFRSAPVRVLVRTYEGDMTRPGLTSRNTLPLLGDGK